MHSQIKRAIVIILGFSLLGLTSCSEKAPKTVQPKVVKQKISTPSPPSEKKAPSANIKDSKAATVDPTTSTSETEPETTSSLVQETMQRTSTYDPKGRFDPFEPLFQEKPKVEIAKGPKEKTKRRIPQTPLEKVALSQLKLTAVIRAPTGNRGMVVDATGKGYVVQNGTYIGLNSGRVIQIENDRIIIEENIEDLMGELTVQKSELKLQKPAGEL